MYNIKGLLLSTWSKTEDVYDHICGNIGPWLCAGDTVNSGVQGPCPTSLIVTQLHSQSRFSSISSLSCPIVRDAIIAWIHAVTNTSQT